MRQLLQPRRLCFKVTGIRSSLPNLSQGAVPRRVDLNSWRGKKLVMRVLLVEDDSATAQSIALMLRSESFNVHTTDLGEEGVDLGKLYDYDIIVLDLNLPDISGYDVLRTLRVSKVRTPI